MNIDLREFQAAVRGMLVAVSGITALVGERIYDAPPQNRGFPYIHLGPIFAADRGADEIEDALEVTFDLHVWSRSRGYAETQSLMRLVHTALHMPFTLPETPFSFEFSSIRVETQRVLTDPDGLTIHGVVSITALLMPR